MKNLKVVTTSVLVALVSLSTASAADFFFTRGTASGGNTSHDWTDLNKWSTLTPNESNSWYNVNPAARLPGGYGDRVIIGAGSAYTGTNTNPADGGYIQLNSNVTLGTFDIDNTNAAAPTDGVAKGIQGTGKITMDIRSGGNKIRHLISGGNNFVSFNVGVDFEINISSAVTGVDGAGTYWRSGESLTFSGDTFKVSHAAGATSFYIYAGNNEANFTKGNAKYIFDTQMIVDRMVQRSATYTDVSMGDYNLEITMKGNVSNQIKLYLVRNGGVVNLEKTGGASAFNTSVLELASRSVVNVNGQNQFTSESTIRFGAPMNISNDTAGIVNMNGNNVNLHSVQFAASLTEVQNISYSGSVKGVIDFGSNSTAQTFTMENGISLYGDNVDTEIDLEYSVLSIKNFNALQDKILSGAKLSEQYLGQDFNSVDIYSIDLLYFEEYDMDDYYISETFNGTYWEYSLIPEPSMYAAIFGALALGFVAYRRKNK